MTNREKYESIFLDVFGVKKEDLSIISFKGVPEWNSVGHMRLISRLEMEFDILIEAMDIFALTTYDAGINILKQYGIEM